MTNNILVEIFCLVDDFCRLFDEEIKKRLLGNTQKRTKGRDRMTNLRISEMVTILFMYSLSPYKYFIFYYLTGV